MNGAQVGVVNVAEEASGLQLGVVNAADEMSGLQIGVINVIRKNGWLLVLPLVNGSF